MAFTDTPVRVNDPTAPAYDYPVWLTFGASFVAVRFDRVFTYDGALYAFASHVGDYWSCYKSSDGGVTWAEVDPNATNAQFPTTSPISQPADVLHMPCYRIGDVIYALATHTQAIGGGINTLKTRVWRFDLATETWLGSILEVVSVSGSGASVCATGSCVRGTEIAILHTDTDGSGGNCLTVYDSATHAVTFGPSSPLHAGSNALCALGSDGRIHVFCSGYSLAPKVLAGWAHFSIEPGNTANSAQDLSTLISLTHFTTSYEFPESIVCHGGYIYFAFKAYLDADFSGTLNAGDYLQLLTFRAAEAAEPSFSIEVIRASNAIEHAIGAYMFDHHIFVAGGELYATYKNESAAAQFRSDLLYARRGAGSWTEQDTLVYSYDDNPPPLENPSYRTITEYSIHREAQGSMPFTPLLNLGQGLWADENGGTPQNAISLFWLLDSTCCCSDFAY